MSTELQEYIDKCLSDIIFNGCKIPSSILKLYFENVALLAKIDQSSKISDSMFEVKKEIGEHNIL
jgi:hypothetical protein